jgi:hypothetical protein
MGKALIWLLVAGFALAPVSVNAQGGEITFITVTPSPATPGETVSIKVDVVGVGCAFTLDFGDQNSGTFGTGQSITHVYNQSAVLTATPASIFPCTGSATATLNVLNLSPPVMQMNCVVVGCNPTISSMPFSQVRPGGLVLLVGTGFGLQSGTASIALQSSDGNEQRFPVQIPPGWWTPTWVAGYIPPSPLPQQSQQILKNFLPQTAAFQLVTYGGAGSNAFHLPFAPALDIQLIDSLWINCSMTANSPSDACQLWGNDNWPAECGVDYSPGYAAPDVGFAAYHGSGWQLFAGNNDIGTDTFSFAGPLSNDWQTAGYSFDVLAEDSSSFAEFLNYPTPGATSNPPSWSVLWNVSGCGFVIYRGEYWISGPLGTNPY